MMASRKTKTKAAKRQRAKQDKVLLVPVFRPGSPEEAKWKDPKERERIDLRLQKLGLDLRKFNRLLISGKTVKVCIVNGKLECWTEEE